MTESSSFTETIVSSTGYDSNKKVLNWGSFFDTTNVPVVGYDPINDLLIVLKGADHSADNTKDMFIYDFRTGSWTKGDTKIGDSTDLSNMFTDPLNGELQIMKNATTEDGSSLEKFTPYAQSSTTVDIQTPFYDFGTTGIKKKLYKVKVSCTGTALSKLRIQGAYDGDTTYSNIFSSSPQNFANIATGGEWNTQAFTIASPTTFNTFSLKIYSSAATTDADWGISEISFIYREMGNR